MSLFDDISNFLSGGELEAQKNALSKIGSSKVTPAQVANAYDQMQVDPTGRNAQLSALQDLQGRIAGGGLDQIDRAKLQQIQDQQAQAVQQQMAGVAQQQQERGFGPGSGAGLAASMLGVQQGANRASDAGMQVGSMALDRRNQAIGQLGQLGTTLAQQDFGQEAQKAQAKNQIQQFNAGQDYNSQAFNAGQTNNAAQAQAAYHGQRQQASNDFWNGLGQTAANFAGGMFGLNSVAGAGQKVGQKLGTNPGTVG